MFNEAVVGLKGEFGNFFSAGERRGSARTLLLGSSWFNTTLCVSPGIISRSPDRLSGFSLSHCLPGRGRGAIKPQGCEQGMAAPPCPPGWQRAWRGLAWPGGGQLSSASSPGAIYPEFHGLGWLEHIQGLASLHGAGKRGGVESLLPL